MAIEYLSAPAIASHSRVTDPFDVDLTRGIGALHSLSPRKLAIPFASARAMRLRKKSSLRY